ncbi:MAG: T9SS type A sorting domain-containing protein [Melioribacteraceae bacterium]|nr:T9SS type A sorting domain-containing protein [Melioribacteraceae bacterium]
MKHLIAVIIFISLMHLTFSQVTVKEKVEYLKQQSELKITEIEKDIIKIEYPGGKTKIKYIGDYIQLETNLNKSATFAITEIDLTTIDTSLYHHKYKFWQEVNIGEHTDPLIIADINRNGFAEIYGIQKEYYGDYSDVTVMEINEQGKFNKIFFYDSTIQILSISDIDKNGLYEVNLRRRVSEETPDPQWLDSWWQHLYYEQPTATSFANTLSFVFEPDKVLDQQEDHVFGDWDGDNHTDQIFVNITTNSSINIYEYNPVINNFDSVYGYDFDSQNFYYRGFAVGDFDEDGKTEFFAGSIKGKVIAIENRGDNDYDLSWEGMVETYNAYLFTQTNDLDGNGKNEIWVGGDATYDGVGKTRITIFESNGDDSYEAVGRIDLIGVFSFWAGNFQAMDVDKDGKEEVLVCIDGNVLILKFNGSRYNQTYEVFYIKQNELGLEGRYVNYVGAILYDLIDDNKEEIVINMIEGKQYVGPRYFSYIYTPDFTVDVEDRDLTLPTEHRLYHNYPNPFNPSTTIRYQVPKNEFVIIKVFNILGEEVMTLVQEEKSAGSYTVNFEANNLPSGIYIINLSAGSFSKSIKTLLLK